MQHCPKCNYWLSNEEQLQGRCFSCGEKFNPKNPYDKEEKAVDFPKNATATALLTIGILCICCGVLAAIIIWGQETTGSYYDHDPDAASNAILSIVGGIVSSVLFIGFSKCVQFLSDIKEILLKDMSEESDDPTGNAAESNFISEEAEKQAITEDLQPTPLDQLMNN